MGEIPNNSRSRKGTSDYFVNEDGSVTKKRTVKPRTQTASFIVNEDGSVTKRTAPKRSVQTTAQPPVAKKVEQPVTRNNTISIIGIGRFVWIIATIIFFILLVVNTYEENETVGDWILILIGLSFFSGLIYSIIIRPILNWLDDLL